MRSTKRLELVTGEVLFVMAPTFARSFEVRAYHLELLQQVQQFHGYYHVLADSALFGGLEPLYQAVCDRLKPSLRASSINSRDRHRFFISEGIVQNPLTPDEQVPDLSGLEKLMGYSLPTEPVSDEVYLTSGDPDADLVASLQLNFKGSAIALMNQYSRVDLISILTQVHNLNRGEEALKELQQERDRALFEENKDAIDQALGGVFL